MLYDTHVHFDLLSDHMELAGILERAAQVKVTRMLAIGGNDAANRFAVDLAGKHPGRILAAVGYNRDLAVKPPPMDELLALPGDPGVAAIGEIGLDFHRGPEQQKEQVRLFEQMLELAARHRLPAIIHCRAADTLMRPILEHHAKAWGGPAGRLGVLHCFTADKAFAAKALDLGFHISFSGIVTFDKTGLQKELGAFVPDDRLLIETDSPFLAPAPYRGKTNEPAYVWRVAETLAEIRKTDVDALAALTFKNAENLFGSKER